ncbi:hypothetical protein [Pleomorphomonas sp. PLEO]|uniref:hypothetical protein n=1 Tax=Pleomorphomonas sp. PLEO TaxID=3239306 RepID=UPI00351E8DCF
MTPAESCRLFLSLAAACLARRDLSNALDALRHALGRANACHSAPHRRLILTAINHTRAAARSGGVTP